MREKEYLTFQFLTIRTSQPKNILVWNENIFNVCVVQGNLRSFVKYDFFPNEHEFVGAVRLKKKD